MRSELTGTIKPHTEFLDSFSEEIWRSTYKYHEDETIDDTLKRVAGAISSVEQTDELKQEWNDKFYDMLSGFKIVPGGRIIANAGTEFKGTTLGNCFVSPRRKFDIDSIEGILEDVLNQCKTLKSEGGYGNDYSWIRPRGAFIHGIGVETPGAVKYMEIYDKTSDIITSGSGKKSDNKKAKGKIRKGAMMATLGIWHPDIEEFIRAKQTPGKLTKFNMSINCTEEFMKKVLCIREIDELLDKENDESICKRLNEEKNEHDKWHLRFPVTTDEHYKEEWDGDLKEWESKRYNVKVYKTISVTYLWNMIMESTYARAEPGILFISRANHFNPLYYGEKIRSTNPCVLMGTLVNTPNGYKRVEDIEVGDEICTVLGKEPVKSIEVNENVKTFKITFSEGGEEYVTASHQYHFVPKSNKNMDKRIQTKRVDELKIGDSVRVESTKFADETFNQEDYNIGLKIGILLGDGCYTEKSIENNGFIISSSIDDVNYNNNVKRLFGNIFNKDYYVDDGFKNMDMKISSKYNTKMLKELHLTPSYSYEKSIDLDFINNYSKSIGVIDGLIATDGNINLSSGNPGVRIFTSSKKLAQDIRRLFLYFGVHAQIHKTGKIGENGGDINGRIIVRKHDKYQISLTGAFVKSFYNHTKLIEIHPEKGQKLNHMVINTRLTGNYWKAKILSIEPHITDTTYDLFCEESDTWITSGYVQVGCGEQVLSSAGVCCLSSCNLTQFITKDRKFDLDSIKKYIWYAVRFLDNVNSYSSAPLQEYKESMEKKRRIGIGVMGWGSALYMMKIKFGSEEANEIREELMSTIAKEAYKASIDLAKEKGMFEFCDPKKHVDGAFIKSLMLDKEYINLLLKTGIRNSSLLSCQPNGNSSLFSNVVSGGIEPVFNPEYIRTVIVNEMPDDIEEVTPKWFEGEWFETDLFKFTKEGDEEILKGIASNGITYKIDKNRGLTKEVLCQDYGVKWLTDRGEWDIESEWAVSASDIKVEDHVNDLKGFARWVDSSISKTINLSYDYPFEDFKDIYTDAYSSGYIKGITTYRAGTMTSVLSAAEEKDAAPEDEEIILEDVTVPTKAPALVSTIRAEGKKWYLTTIMDEGQKRPIAFFVHTNNHEKSPQTLDAVDHLLNLSERKGIPPKWIEDTKNKMKSDNNSTKIARCISLNLRHGVLIKNVVAALSDVEDVFVGTFLFQIRKHLMTWIKDGDSVEDSNGGAKCPECETQLIYREGCRICLSCSYSACS